MLKTVLEARVGVSQAIPTTLTSDCEKMDSKDRVVAISGYLCLWLRGHVKNRLGSCDIPDDPYRGYAVRNSLLAWPRLPMILREIRAWASDDPYLGLRGNGLGRPCGCDPGYPGRSLPAGMLKTDSEARDPGCLGLRGNAKNRPVWAWARLSNMTLASDCAGIAVILVEPTNPL